MHSQLVLAVALAVLAPGLSGLTVDRCELKDKLMPLVSPSAGAVNEQLLATALCEVERFNSSAGRVRREAGGRGRNGGRSEKDSSAESSEENHKPTLTLAKCISVVSGNKVVDAKCIRLIFMSLIEKASAVCKAVDPVDFFKACIRASTGA